LVEVWLPYGSSEIPVRVPEERLTDIFTRKSLETPLDPIIRTQELAEAANDMMEQARKAKKICIALGATESAEVQRKVLVSLVRSLLQAGVQKSSIVLLRTPDAPEVDSDELVDLMVLQHDPKVSQVTDLSGCQLEYIPSLDSTFLQSDVKILLGELNFHHMLQLSGLVDTVFPKLSTEKASRAQLSNRRGISVNEICRERVEIASAVPNLFVCGFVLDGSKMPARIALGTLEESLRDLKQGLHEVASCEVTRMADIVVMGVGGNPTDATLLSAVETFPAGLTVMRRDAVLIVAAECSQGHGGTEFYEWCAEHKEPRYLESRLRHVFNYNGYKSAFLERILQAHRIYLVSTIPDHYVQDIFGMRAARTVNAALQTAQRSIGSDSDICVIPNASRVLLRRPVQVR